ncbi:MAG: hypothetical protein KIS80_01730, partial [Anaerolineales bacterium]|nr:hypothetical protein [Anaerolineales bacterium]
MSTPETRAPSRFLLPMMGELPYFRALLRAVEAEFYDDFVLSTPVLDLGCGDGLFAHQVFEQTLDVGIDPALGAPGGAKSKPAYHQQAPNRGRP